MANLSNSVDLALTSEEAVKSLAIRVVPIDLVTSFSGLEGCERAGGAGLPSHSNFPQILGGLGLFWGSDLI